MSQVRPCRDDGNGGVANERAVKIHDAGERHFPSIVSGDRRGPGEDRVSTGRYVFVKASYVGTFPRDVRAVPSTPLERLRQLTGRCARHALPGPKRCAGNSEAGEGIFFGQDRDGGGRRESQKVLMRGLRSAGRNVVVMEEGGG